MQWSVACPLCIPLGGGAAVTAVCDHHRGNQNSARYTFIAHAHMAELLVFLCKGHAGLWSNLADPPSLFEASLPCKNCDCTVLQWCMNIYVNCPEYNTVEPSDSVSVVSVIRGLLRTENINTFAAKVDHGRFKYLHFNLPASTLVDLKFTSIGFATIRGFRHPQ
jgi:hypothetical protein